jgi:hypothetical protein
VLFPLLLLPPPPPPPLLLLDALCAPPAPGLRHLMSLSKVLKARRAAAGALQLASPEVKFTIDDSAQDALDMGMYQVGDWEGGGGREERGIHQE